MANKVEFGISNLYVGTYEVDDDGDVTLGTPYHQAGAVGFSPEEQSDIYNFYADNIAYWSSYNGGSMEGDLTVAKFSDQFKTNFLGYVTLDDGGLALIKGATKPKVYIMFQVEGDDESRRIIMYNVSLGAINREYNTIEENREPITESIPVTVTGDNGTGITMVSYKETDAVYDSMFTTPPVPTLPSE